MLQEEDEVLVASEYPWLRNLSQPVQRRVTPHSTVLAHLMPGFLPLSPPTLVSFALKTKHISSKMTTEPWLLAGFEPGCARKAESAASWFLTSYF